MDSSTITRDPVCGKEVDTLRARAVGIFGGVTYYFCSADCKGKFKDPRQTPPHLAKPPTVERRKNAERAAQGGEARDDTPPPRGPSEPTPTWQQPADLDEAGTPSRSGARLWLLLLVVFASGGAVLWYVFLRHP
jgi:YHS domain-containing protein